MLENAKKSSCARSILQSAIVFFLSPSSACAILEPDGKDIISKGDISAEDYSHTVQMPLVYFFLPLLVKEEMYLI